jgi:hypothetical protein
MYPSPNQLAEVSRPAANLPWQVAMCREQVTAANH